MRKLYGVIMYSIFLSLSIPSSLAQEKAPLSLRLHIQPQVSSLNPYDPGFISNDAQVSPSLAFGVEATRSFSKNLEITVGYHYSAQAGNFQLVWCDPVPTNLIDPTGDRAFGNSNCPMPRGKVRLFKIPLSLGWRFIQNKKYMSRLSFGPQFQASLSQSYMWLHPYRKFSLAFMTEWSNYFKLSKNFSLLAGLRFDRNVTPLDQNSLNNAFGNSLGLVIGAEYTIWTKSKTPKTQ